MANGCETSPPPPKKKKRCTVRVRKMKKKEKRKKKTPSFNNTFTSYVLFVTVLAVDQVYCTSKQLVKDDFIENLHVLSCIVLSKSVLLISCVFGSRFEQFKQSGRLSNTLCTSNGHWHKHVNETQQRELIVLE